MRALACALCLGLAACSTAEWRPVVMNGTLPAEPSPEPRGGRPSGERGEGRSPHAAAETAPRKARPSPLPADLPRDVAGKLDVDLTCDERPCVLDDAAPPAGALRGAVIVLSATLSRVRSKLTMTRYADHDAYGVVVRGAARLRGTEEGAGRPLAAWSAFHVPGGGADVVAEAADTHVVLVLVPARAKAGRKTPAPSWRTRPGTIETRDLAAAPDLSWAGGAMHARTAFEGDKQPASLGVLMASSTATVAPHRHEGATEILVMLRGEGMFEVGEGDAARSTAARDGSTSVIPPGTTHAWLPAGVSPLVAVQLYTPPGPEQRFKELAKAATEASSR